MEARLLEIGEVDGVVDVAERVTVAEPNRETMGEHGGRLQDAGYRLQGYRKL
jgi:hypothetical protein